MKRINELIAEAKAKCRKNRVVRAIMAPFVILSSQANLLFYKYTKDAAFIREMQGRYTGKRCFIIGNGPSLTTDDLERIKDEYAFASNRIYKIFERTNWKPTFYFCADLDVLSAELGTIKKLPLQYKFIRKSFWRWNLSEKDNICQFIQYGPYHIHRERLDKKDLSTDCSRYISMSSNVTCNMIEFAIYLGFREIYLLGVDASFPIAIHKDGTVEIDSSLKSHFDGADEEIDARTVKKGYKDYFYPDASNQCYELYRSYAKKNQIKICNCTRGGKLEVFERKALEEIIKP